MARTRGGSKSCTVLKRMLGPHEHSPQGERILIVL
jgi:hypothetical protein